ncbi:MAG: hypothetical protein GY881_01085 [Gammaproteobacteria bacterium]|nr:hypothetical protein [Gammaproteobacteria bacterium]
MTNAIADYAERSNRILTFMLGETRFAIDITSILSIADDFNKLEQSSNHQDAFLGYLYYRNKPVNTFEISTLLGRQSNRQQLTSTIEALEQAEQDHRQWVQALEASLYNDSPFELARSASECEFNNWLTDQIDLADHTTLPLLQRFSDPHSELHALADKLFSISKIKGSEAAMKELRTAKRGLINENARLFKYAQEQLKSSVHPLVLYITRDGVTPWFALILDSMDDIVAYEDEQFTQLREYNFKDTQAAMNDPVYGYIHNPDVNEQDCLILSAERLAQLILH